MFARTRDSWRMASRKFKLRLFIALTLILVLLVAFTWVLRSWRGGYQPVSEPGSAPLLEQGGGEMVKLEELGLAERKPGPMNYAERAVLERHFSAIGGVDALSGVSSIRISGKLAFPDGKTQDIIVVKKGGDRIRVTMRMPGWQRVVALTPEDKWEALWNMGELHAVRDMDVKEAESLRRSGYVTSELFMALQNSWEISYAGQKDFNYKMAHCFEVRIDKNLLIRFFIDPTTFLDVGREDRLYLEDGGMDLTRHLYSDHFESNGLLVPAKVMTSVNDELKQTFTIEQVDINPGILDTGFERPPEPVKP